jgi:hypothetical protein
MLQHGATGFNACLEQCLRDAERNASPRFQHEMFEAICEKVGSG